jgi:hypothetical protein
MGEDINNQTIIIMKTKQLTPREAMELLLITGKPLPCKLQFFHTYLSIEVSAVNMFSSNSPFFSETEHPSYNEPVGWKGEIEIEIPEGRNPDELTLAHLQMGENGHEYRLLEEGEETKLPTDNIEYWDGEEKTWIKGASGYSGALTYRTRKAKGHFLPKSQETEQKTVDDAEQLWKIAFALAKYGDPKPWAIKEWQEAKAKILPQAATEITNNN